MPPYCLPNIKAVTTKLVSRAFIFLKRAGTVIFVVAIIVWVLASFLRRMDRAPGQTGGAVAAQQLERSYLGKMSRGIAPFFLTLGLGLEGDRRGRRLIPGA